MTVSYKKLWKLLIDRNLKKKDLREMSGISPATLSKLGRNETVNGEVIQSSHFLLTDSLVDLGNKCGFQSHYPSPFESSLAATISPFYKPAPLDRPTLIGAGFKEKKDLLSVNKNCVSVSLPPSFQRRSRSDVKNPVNLVYLAILPSDSEGLHTTFRIKGSDDRHIYLHVHIGTSDEKHQFFKNVLFKPCGSLYR